MIKTEKNIIRPIHFVCMGLFIEGGNMNKQNVKKMVMIALFCALSYICVFVFRIKVSFLTFDAKDAIITISGFLYGPLSAIATTVITAVLEFITVSDTGVYGLVMNVLSSLAFSLPASVLYRYKKSANSAVLGLGLSIAMMTMVMCIANLLITPFYMHVDVGVVKSMLPSLILPFNMTKALLNSGIILFIYKPFVNALRKIGMAPKNEKSDYCFNKKTVLLIILSLVLISLAFVIFFMLLDGSFHLI